MPLPLFSVRERQVLDVIGRDATVGFSSLALLLEKRIPEDELQTVVESLKKKGAVSTYRTARSFAIQITHIGRAALTGRASE